MYSTLRRNACACERRVTKSIERASTQKQAWPGFYFFISPLGKALRWCSRFGLFGTAFRHGTDKWVLEGVHAWWMPCLDPQNFSQEPTSRPRNVVLDTIFSSVRQRQRTQHWGSTKSLLVARRRRHCHNSIDQRNVRCPRHPATMMC